MPANVTTPFSNTQFQGWASFFGGNVQAPQAPPPSAFGAAALGGQPPTSGQYTGGWAYPDAWANFYEGRQGFQAPQNQNTPAGALAATQYANNINNPNDPNLLGWEQAYGNPQTILARDQNWAQSLGQAPTSTPSGQLTGGWENPEAWAAYYGGFNGFTAPTNAGSPASALAAAATIAQTSNPQDNPALLGWVSDYGQPGSVLANTPNWAASLGTPNVNAQGQDVGQTNTQGWTSPLAWAAYYGGFQGFNGPVDNTLQAAQNWAGVTNANDPSLLGWELDYGNPQTVISVIQASPQYQQFLAAQSQFQQAQSDNAQEQALLALYQANPQAYFNQAQATTAAGTSNPLQAAAWQQFYGNPAEIIGAEANYVPNWQNAPIIQSWINAGINPSLALGWESVFGPPGVETQLQADWNQLYGYGYPLDTVQAARNQNAWNYYGPTQAGANAAWAEDAFPPGASIYVGPTDVINLPPGYTTSVTQTGPNQQPVTILPYGTLAGGPQPTYGSITVSPPSFPTQPTVAPNGTLQLPSGIGVGNGGQLTSVAGVNVSNQFTQPLSLAQELFNPNVEGQVATQPVLLASGQLASPGTPLQTIRDLNLQFQTQFGPGSANYNDLLNFQRSQALHNIQNEALRAAAPEFFNAGAVQGSEFGPGIGSPSNTGLYGFPNSNLSSAAINEALNQGINYLIYGGENFLGTAGGGGGFSNQETRPTMGGLGGMFPMLEEDLVAGSNPAFNFDLSNALSAQQAATILGEAQRGLVPELAAPNSETSFEFVGPPPDSGADYNRNVDDLGRPIPDVGPPAPVFDFNNAVQSIQNALGNLGAGWTTPPADPLQNFPDISLPTNTQASGIAVTPATGIGAAPATEVSPGAFGESQGTVVPVEQQPTAVNLGLESGLTNPVPTEGFGAPPFAANPLNIGQGVPFFDSQDLTGLNSSQFNSAPPIDWMSLPNTNDLTVGKYQAQNANEKLVQSLNGDWSLGGLAKAFGVSNESLVGAGLDPAIRLDPSKPLQPQVDALIANLGFLARQAAGPAISAGMAAKGLSYPGIQSAVSNPDLMYGTLNATGQPQDITPSLPAPPPWDFGHPTPPADIPYNNAMAAPPASYDLGAARPDVQGYGAYNQGEVGGGIFQQYPPIQAGYSYIPGAFGEIDPYNFSSAPYPAGGYGGGSAALPDLAAQLGLQDVPNVAYTHFNLPGYILNRDPRGDFPESEGDLFPNTDWSKFNPTPTENVEDVRTPEQLSQIQAGYSYIPGMFGDNPDPYGFERPKGESTFSNDVTFTPVLDKWLNWNRPPVEKDWAPIAAEPTFASLYNPLAQSLGLYGDWSNPPLEAQATGLRNLSGKESENLFGEVGGVGLHADWSKFEADQGRPVGQAPYNIGAGFGGGPESATGGVQYGQPVSEAEASGVSPQAIPTGPGEGQPAIDWMNLPNLNFLQEDVPAAASVPSDVFAQGSPFAGAPGQDLSYTASSSESPKDIAARAAQIRGRGDVSEIDPNGPIGKLGYYGAQGIRPDQVAKTTIDTPYGPITVAQDAASDFGNFFQTLSDQGFPTGSDSGSYNLRTKFGAGKGAVTDSTPIGSISEHAYGTAVDINNSTELTNDQINWIAAHPDEFQDALQDSNIAWGHQINLGFPDTPHMQWMGPSPQGTYGTPDLGVPLPPSKPTEAWPGSGLEAPTAQPQITGPEVGYRAYTPGQAPALSTDFGYTGPTGASGLATENPFQDGTIYTTPASMFGGSANPNQGAVSLRPITDTEQTIALPVTADVAREINANGGMVVVGPTGTMISGVFVADIGPNQDPNRKSQLSSINRGVDLSPALYAALGAQTDGTVHLQYTSGGSPVAYSYQPPPRPPANIPIQ